MDSQEQEQERAPLPQTLTETEPEPKETEEVSISSQVCDVCLKDNLLASVGILTCSRCKAPFCIHFSSRIDTQYCVSCMSDLSVTKEIITKAYEHYNEETDTTTRYARKARQIRIEGLDWLFAQRKIKLLTDPELDMVVEYHRNYLSLLLVEAEQRRTEKMHRYAGVKIQLPTPTTSTTTTKTTTIKSTKTSSTKKQAQAQAALSVLLQSLTAKGMSVDQITAMLKGAGK